MRITDLLKEEAILLNASFQSKAEAIDVLTQLQADVGNVSDREKYRQGILAREADGTTAVGDGIAIPHAKSEVVVRPGLAAATVPNGVDYESLDGKPSNLIFMIAAPMNGDLHLEVLSRLTVMLMDAEFRQALLNAKTKKEFLDQINQMENKKFGAEEPKAPVKAGYRILAVTACPTGIAHTYMAAEALEKAGQEMGMPLKAETNGSGGAKNVLTSEEIANCDAIIIAADKSVEMARFDGKPVLITKVSTGINKANELVQRVIDGDIPVYHHHGEKAEVRSSGEKESAGRIIYKHLMNGVSHMLPFVVAGGIFTAIAFLIDAIAGVPNGADFGSVTAAAAFFKTIGGFTFNFMLPILAAFIASSIADRPGLLVGFVGGYLASAGTAFFNFAESGTDIPSGFLGALVAGFAGGYIMLGIEKLCDKLPRSLEGIKPVLIYPLIGLAAIAVVMCTINPFMGLLNNWLNDLLASLSGGSKIILGCALGAMMSIDMGGPFNKAAYLFGTGGLTQAAAVAGTVAATGYYEIMAAVMIGGMVPPIAIALAATFFKNRFTAEERKNAPVNYVLGLSFITEGAIPYAAADPLRVIPSCAIGAAVAGGLSMLFGCTLMAPHGGIFVFAVVGNWWWYLVSLAAGSVVGMILLAILKKPVDKKLKKTA